MTTKKAAIFGNIGLALGIVLAACGAETVPTAIPVVAGDARIQVSGNLILVTAEMLQEDLVPLMAEIDGVSAVDSYLVVDAEPDGVVGVSPGSPLRVRGEPVSVVSGEGFPAGDENVAIPGINVNANLYGFGMVGSAMAHRLQVGQSFELQGQRLRVVDLYRADRDELDSSILVPLSTAQRLFNLEGVITEAVVSVDPPEKVDAVRRAIVQLLEER